ncbi:small, acid-soluble spore protein, H family [Clostridium sp. DL1XJH146]
MQLNKLEEIIQSNQKHNILYNGHPVWIEGYDKIARIAQIRLLDTQAIECAYVKELVDPGEIR